MSKIRKAYEALMAGGNANSMTSVSSRILRDTCVGLSETARSWLMSIYYDLGVGVMREDAIIQWEKTFGLFPAPTDTLAERQQAIEEAWGSMVGAQGPGYIQAQLNRAGFDVVVTENIPVADLTVGFGLTYGATQPTYVESNPDVGYGASAAGYLLGNGDLAEWGDPIETPGPALGSSAPTYGATAESSPSYSETTSGAVYGDDVNRWGYVFIIEGPAGTKAQIPPQSKQRFEETVLKLKPAHLGVLLRVDYADPSDNRITVETDVVFDLGGDDELVWS